MGEQPTFREEGALRVDKMSRLCLLFDQTHGAVVTTPPSPTSRDLLDEQRRTPQEKLEDRERKRLHKKGVVHVRQTSVVDGSGASGGAVGGGGGGGGGSAGHAGRAPTSLQEDDNHDKLTCAICNAGAEPAVAGDDSCGDDSGSGGGRHGLVRVQSQAPTFVRCPPFKVIAGLSHYNKRHTSSFERAYRKGLIFDTPGAIPVSQKWLSRMTEKTQKKRADRLCGFVE